MRGASVRASLAIIELARGYKCIRGKLTKEELKDAALLSLPKRIKVRPESEKTPNYIILEIIQEVVFEIQSLEYGDPFKKKPPGEKEPSAEFTKELMDFQEQQYKGKTRLKNLHAENQKQIIMISDGLPNISSEGELYFRTGNEEMENFGISFGTQNNNPHFHSEIKTEIQTLFKNLNASSSAYSEVKKSRKKEIKVSFLYIGSDDERGISFARRVVRLGSGTFYHVKDITELPEKALRLADA